MLLDLIAGWRRDIEIINVRSGKSRLHSLLVLHCVILLFFLIDPCIIVIVVAVAVMVMIRLRRPRLAPGCSPLYKRRSGCQLISILNHDSLHRSQSTSCLAPFMVDTPVDINILRLCQMRQWPFLEDILANISVLRPCPREKWDEMCSVSHSYSYALQLTYNNSRLLHFISKLPMLWRVKMQWYTCHRLRITSTKLAT